MSAATGAATSIAVATIEAAITVAITCSLVMALDRCSVAARGAESTARLVGLAFERDAHRFWPVIRDHEAGHAAISRDHIKQLNAKLDGAVCSSVNTIVRQWATGLSAAQEAYDRREYAKPWPRPPAGY